MWWRCLLLTTVVLAAACGGDGIAGSAPPSTAVVVRPDPAAPDGRGCADVIAAQAEPDGEGTLLFRVTVRSADTGPEKYADVWEVRGPDGSILGRRELLHDHAAEQPFTRSLAGVPVPAGVTEVVIAARDSVAGFCGDELVLPLD